MFSPFPLSVFVPILNFDLFKQIKRKRSRGELASPPSIIFFFLFFSQGRNRGETDPMRNECQDVGFGRQRRMSRLVSEVEFGSCVRETGFQGEVDDILNGRVGGGSGRESGCLSRNLKIKITINHYPKQNLKFLPYLLNPPPFPISHVPSPFSLSLPPS